MIIVFLICFLLASCVEKQISFDEKKWKNKKNCYYEL